MDSIQGTAVVLISFLNLGKRGARVGVELRGDGEVER